MTTRRNAFLDAARRRMEETSSKDGLNVPASVHRRGYAWCSQCWEDFDLSHIYKIGRLYLCEKCWRALVILFGECFPTLISISAELYTEERDYDDGDTH